jgi:hypothetical protein
MSAGVFRRGRRRKSTDARGGESLAPIANEFTLVGILKGENLVIGGARH